VLSELAAERQAHLAVMNALQGRRRLKRIVQPLP
jgi:hypothetical protein